MLSNFTVETTFLYQFVFCIRILQPFFLNFKYSDKITWNPSILSITNYDLILEPLELYFYVIMLL